MPFFLFSEPNFIPSHDITPNVVPLCFGLLRHKSMLFVVSFLRFLFHFLQFLLCSFMPFEQILYYLISLPQMILIFALPLKVVLFFCLHSFIDGISDGIGIEIGTFGVLERFLRIFLRHHRYKAFGTLRNGFGLFLRTLSHDSG